MRLNRFTDIGLRALMYLATQDREPPVTVAELAEQLNVPRSHMVKVVHRLGQLGWVLTQRGRQGGLRLAPAAMDVGLGQVVRVLEDDEAPVDCGKPACPLDGRCVLQGALGRAMRAFYAELDAVTLGTVNHRPTSAVLMQLHRSYLRRLSS
ncbi:Rrf2 family transcriptional regulator [uncultured Piscinibacter sp.]|uniref:RrF2 family transcriptional regulator n=1 Tax=uncultured Piscinibacter sp. TaxID=1131835 RepID=UPI00263A11B0|nr:Rrf2 family transcriptional regulator [uncultured Piscinibacter sp.]